MQQKTTALLCTLTLAAFALTGVACAPASTPPARPPSAAAPATPSASAPAPDGQGQTAVPSVPASAPDSAQPALGGVPLPPGFPADAMTQFGDRLPDWNEQRLDQNRVAWEHTGGGNVLWVVLGVRAGSDKTPHLLGIGEEAGVPVLQASFTNGPGAPLALATFPSMKDAWAMRLRFDEQGPGVWLGYVPVTGVGGATNLGADLGDAATGEDPLQTAKAWAKTLGFSDAAVLTAGERGIHEPSAMKTATVVVQDRGETFTIRLAQKEGSTRWFVWSVHFGLWPKVTPMFLED